MTPTTAARADLAALTTRADALERAAGVLEARHADHLREVARALRDSWAPGQRNYGTVSNGGAANFTREGNPYVFNSGNENSWHYLPDGRGRKRLADYRADYLAWCRGEREAVPLGLDDPPAGMVEALDLADACRTRAAVDRRIVDVLAGDGEEWSPDPSTDRAFAEQELVRAIVEGQELVAALSVAGLDPVSIAPPVPTVADAAPDHDPSAVRVIGYGRASTEEQATDGATLAAQRHLVEQECERRGWVLVDFLTDTASGKTTARRPGLATALGMLEQRTTGAPTAIVVSRLDRLTRSVADGGRLFDRARSGGWGIVALDLGVDTTTPAGELVANVMVSVGQWERRVISERTKAGMAQRKREGVRMGRPSSLEQTERPEERARMEAALPRLRAMRAEGMSLRAIAAAMNEEGIPGAQGGRWHDRTVRLALLRHGTTNATEAR